TCFFLDRRALRHYIDTVHARRNPQLRRPARSRPQPARRDDDRGWVDDWLRHFHHFRGIVATGRFAGMVTCRVGLGGRADDYRRALLRGAGGDVAACWWTVRLSA